MGFVINEYDHSYMCMLAHVRAHRHMPTCLKYLRENWYIGSTSAMLATTKYMTEPRSATVLYFSRAAVIFVSVSSASARR